LEQPTRKIIHCDCDCFYAAVEARDNPGLQGLPVAVGGSPEHRGVVATCNYEARKFGIHSAMSSAMARRKCPQLVIIKPDMNKYRAVSRQIQQIFHDYTDLVEPLSLDEAFLDVTDSRQCSGSAIRMAGEIRARVSNQLGITLSAGVAPNKFLAKIASDWNKPNGLFVILPEQVDEFVQALGVEKLFGVGKVTARKLNTRGVHTCQDLRAWSEDQLIKSFGLFGKRLYDLCRGIDQRPVHNSRVRKSLSVENTYSQDLPDIDACLSKLPELGKRLDERMQNIADSYRVQKLVVKLKFRDFVSTTVETKADQINSEVFKQLVITGYQRHNKPVRLLGLGVRLAYANQATHSNNPTATRISDPINDSISQLALSL